MEFPNGVPARDIGYKVIDTTSKDLDLALVDLSKHRRMVYGVEYFGHGHMLIVYNKKETHES